MVRLALALSAFGLALCGIAGAADSADVFTYRTVLTSAAEVPKPTAAAGAGGVFTSTITKNGSAYALAWKLTYRKLSGPAVAAHIHRGGAGAAGGVILALCGPCTSGQTGKAKLTKSVADAMRRGTAYVNVHTAKNSAGEIRGQTKLTKTVVGQPPPSTPPPPPDESPPPPPPPDY
jgi:CHRD domain